MTSKTTKDCDFFTFIVKKRRFVTIFSSQWINYTLEKITRTTGQKNGLDTDWENKYNIRCVITKMTMGHTLDCRRGCFLCTFSGRVLGHGRTFSGRYISKSFSNYHITKKSVGLFPKTNV